MIVTIDCQYLKPRFAASYLMIEGDRAAFIENNTFHSVPLLLAELKARGLRPEQVEYLIITHVHLDHAGGSHALMQACPKATLLAHPRAAPHVIDPSKLVSSAKKVYGEERFRELYGELGPIDASRVRAMEDGEELGFGSRRLKFLHTRGHANHHFCVLDSGDSGSSSIFTGDAFGLAYPDLQARGLFIIPSTSPTDFDPTLAHESVERILASGAERAYLTHFGEVTDLKDAARQLHDHLDFSGALLEELVRADLDEPALTKLAEERVRAHYISAMEKIGLTADTRALALLDLDLELNASGIAYVASKNKKRRT